MKYTTKQVLDILKLVTDNPESILLKWNNIQDNIKLDLDKYDYPVFLYTFPIILNGIEVASVTLGQFTNTGFESKIQMLMSKYLTSEKLESSWTAYSHDTYLSSYLTINKPFKLDKHPTFKDLYTLSSYFIDDAGNMIKYRISYGDVNDSDVYNEYMDDTNEYDIYSFDNIYLQIERKEIAGWKMGKKINETIEGRLNNQNEKSR